jgi:hypothetical protein
MIRLLTSALLLGVTAGAALAQTTQPREDLAQVPLPGPIVGGRHLQPTQYNIVERQARLMPGDETAPASIPGRPKLDKELDDLYDQLMKQSQPGP